MVRLAVEDEVDAEILSDRFGCGNLRRGQVAKGKSAESTGAARVSASHVEGWAAAYVTRNGKATGHEHAYAYDADSGKVVDFGSSGHTDYVAITAKMKEAALLPDRRIVIHHNHPDGSSLSKQDLSMFVVYPGLSGIVAHDHSGTSYRVAPRQRGNLAKSLDIAYDEAVRWVRNFQRTTVSARQDSAWLVSHLTCKALAVAGVIAYGFPLNAEQRPQYDFADVLPEQFLANAARLIEAQLRRS